MVKKKGKLWLSSPGAPKQLDSLCSSPELRLFGSCWTTTSTGCDQHEKAELASPATSSCTLHRTAYSNQALESMSENDRTMRSSLSDRIYINKPLIPLDIYCHYDCNDCFTVPGHITTWRTLCSYLNNILINMQVTLGFRGVSQSCGWPRPGAAVVDDAGISPSGQDSLTRRHTGSRAQKQNRL